MSLHARNVLDIRKAAKPAASRVRAQVRMTPLFTQERQPRLRVRKRKQRLIALIVCTLIAGTLFLALGYASHVRRLQISDILIAGVSRIPESDIRSSIESTLAEEWLSLFSKRNVLLYPREEIESSLYQDFPRIRHVKMSRESLLAQVVTVTVRERESFALWCGQGSCFLIDDTGYVFAEGSDVLSGYIFRGGLLPDTPPVGQYFLQGRFDDMRSFLDMLTAEGYPPREIVIENDADFSVSLSPGFSARFSFEHANERAVRNLKTALESEALRTRQDELVAVDVRFENKVYYSFKGAENESGEL